MPLRTPPPEVGILTFLAPNKNDQGLIEFWSTLNANYTPLDVGSPHPDSRLYPNFRLGNQRPVQGDEAWVIRTWITDETNPDWYNWSQKLAGEDNAFPIFIRTYREPRLTYTPRTKGTPLKTLYKLVLTENGSGYTNGVFPNVVFDAPLVAPTEDAIAHGVVAPDGTISEAVLTFGGEGYEQDVQFNVDAPINGNPAAGIAYVQPQTVILTREEASLYPEDSPFYAQYLQVVRVYETIPGPTFNETRLDVDGGIINVATTRKLCSDITTEESIDAGTWCKTTSKPTDIDVICEEVVECRTVPGNPMISTKIDNDGMVLTRTQTLIDSTTAVSEETITLGVWTKKYIEEKDGSDVVEWQIVEERDVPGNPMVDTKIDKDGVPREVVKTLKDTTTITPSEVVSGGGVWITTEKEAVSDLVAWEVVTARDVPGNTVASASVDGDHEVQNISTLLRREAVIVPSATEAGGFITTVEKEAVTDLVSNEVRTVTRWLDKAVYRVEIPESIIPIEFRASIPTVTESHILGGTASMPTLVGNDFMRQETQLTKLLYERRVQSLGDIDFPIITIGQEVSSEYGGAVLDVIRRLQDTDISPDQGEDIVSSYVNVIGENLMWFRETKKRPSTDAEWPINPSRLWDENYRKEYDATSQWVATGTSEDPDPGGVWAWTSEVRAKDKWHAEKINISKPEPDYVDEASALIFYEMKPFAFPGYVVFSGYGYYVRSATAKLIQHTIRTWWVKSATTPTSGPTGSGADVEFDPIVTDTVVINNLALSGLTYAENVLHDDLSYGILFFPATTPSATEYRYGTPTGTTLTNLVGIYTPGTSYLLGDDLDVSGDGGFVTLTVTALGVDGSILNYTPLAGSFGWTPAGNYGPYGGSGGGGTGAQFYVQAVEVPTYDDSTKWIGNEHVVGASVVAEKEKDIWKITTESVTMQ